MKEMKKIMQEMNDYGSNLVLDIALKVENLSKVYISSMGKIVSQKRQLLC
jgi:hypothetical protein